MDLAQGHLDVIDFILSDGLALGHQIFNFGTGKGVTVLEIINMYKEVCARRIPVNYVDRRTGDME